MNFTPDIRTKYSLLTHISADDMSKLKEVFDDAETRRFLPELYELLDSNGGLWKFTSSFEQYAQECEGYLWGIKYNNELVGFVAIMDISDNPALFYAMHPTYRLQGYMKDAVSVIMDYLGKSKLCCKVSTDVYKNNNASIHILKQLGFSGYKEDDDKLYLSKLFVQ